MRRKKQMILNKDLFSTRIFLIVALLILLSIACNVPIMASQSNQEKQPGFVETSVAETMRVLDVSQGQNGNGQSDQGDDEVAVTDKPDITDTPTLTPTATDTPTPEVAMIYASGNTNCRTGQGTEFGWLVTLQEGDEAEAVGIDTSGEYWYIRRPDQPNSFCWLWGEYVTPSGPYQSLPVYTPVPTPTPGFDYEITYKNKGGPCGPYYYTQYQIENIGAFTIESWKTTADDHTGGSNPKDLSSDTFYSYSVCATVGTQNNLTPGEGHHLIMLFLNDPTGHDISVKFMVCQEDGLGGDCLTKTIRHTP